MKSKIQQIIASGESETLEFKAAFNKEVIETLCAFANCKGGSVVIGVNNKSVVVGVACKVETVQLWINEIKLNTSPSIIPDREQDDIDGMHVVVITVREFPVKPVAFRNRYFKRVANSNHCLSLTEVSNLHLQSLQLSWDSHIDDNSTINELNLSKVNAFLGRVRGAVSSRR